MSSFKKTPKQESVKICDQRDRQRGPKEGRGKNGKIGFFKTPGHLIVKVVCQK